MQSRIGILVLATALAVSPAAAQNSQTLAKASILQSLRLPGATQEARDLGVGDQDIREMLDLARDDRFTIGDLTQVIEARNESIREYGPVDNFGAFVQARHREGLRGRDLAAAIRAEHAAHGKGKGYVKGNAGYPEGKGGPGVYGHEGKKPGNADKIGSKGGKSQGAGKSNDRGGKPDSSKKGGNAKNKNGGSE